MDSVRNQLFFSERAPQGAGVRVAVLDTGIDTEHPDLLNTIDITASRSFAALSTDITDRCYHGTHVAGIISGTGAASDNRYRGLAPEAKLIVMKISTSGRGLEGDAAAAAEAAVDEGADIINYSNSYSPMGRGQPPWVWPSVPSAVEDVLDVACSRGVLCVVAAGNDGPMEGSVNRPGGLLSVLTVGAVNPDGRVWTPSSRGPYRVMRTLPAGGVRRWDAVVDHVDEERPKPDLVAPGVNVIAPRASAGVEVIEAILADPTDPTCRYVKISGTSQAAAVVTALAACLLDLARANGIDLGGNVGQTLRSLLVLAARPLAEGSAEACGAGIPQWPILTQTLRDFANDDQFRQLVIGGGPQLRLL